MKVWGVLAVLVWLSLGFTPAAETETVIFPVSSTSPTGVSADDPAIWIHPEDSSRSVVIGTDKTLGIYVWDMDGNLLQHIPQGTRVNNVDTRYGFQLDGASVDVVAANLRDIGKLAFFKVNPDYTANDVLIQIADKDSSNNDIQSGSYGFCLYQRPSDSAIYVFERPNIGDEVSQYLLEDDGSGIVVTWVRDLNYNGGSAEGFAADDELGFVYITEEGVGIHKYYADPDFGSDDGIGLFATADGIVGDREGLGLYECNDGTGYLVLSSQGNSQLKIYAREGDNRFLKTIIPKDHNGNGGLGTDGVDVSSSVSLPNFANGLLVVHDEGGQRYHLYDWADAAENDLTICPNWDVPEPCTGDFGPDGDVDGSDLDFLIAALAVYNPAADFNNDAVINGVDIAPFSAHFGRDDCP